LPECKTDSGSAVQIQTSPTPLLNTQISETAHFDPGRWTQI
jgi:hypothetical protein